MPTFEEYILKKTEKSWTIKDWYIIKSNSDNEK
jgi:hypothetical protein